MNPKSHPPEFILYSPCHGKNGCGKFILCVEAVIMRNELWDITLQVRLGSDCGGLSILG